MNLKDFPRKYFCATLQLYARKYIPGIRYTNGITIINDRIKLQDNSKIRIAVNPIFCMLEGRIINYNYNYDAYSKDISRLFNISEDDAYIIKNTISNYDGDDTDCIFKNLAICIRNTVFGMGENCSMPLLLETFPDLEIEQMKFKERERNGFQ